MSWTWTRQIVQSIQLTVAIGHFQRDRAAQRHAFPHTTENIDGVCFDPLPAAATITALTPPQLRVDWLKIDRHAGREAIYERDQRFAVRFTGGPVTEHGGDLVGPPSRGGRSDNVVT